MVHLPYSFTIFLMLCEGLHDLMHLAIRAKLMRRRRRRRERVRGLLFAARHRCSLSTHSASLSLNIRKLWSRVVPTTRRVWCPADTAHCQTLAAPTLLIAHSPLMNMFSGLTTFQCSPILSNHVTSAHSEGYQCPSSASLCRRPCQPGGSHSRCWKKGINLLSLPLLYLVHSLMFLRLCYMAW